MLFRSVARFRSGGVRRRRFALHHLWKKIHRRRAQLRGARARTARYMRWLFSQKKDSIPLLLKYFGSLATRWREDPPADFVRQKHPPRGKTLCGRLLLPFGGFGFRILGSSPFPPPVVLLHGDAHSLGWNEQRRGPASTRIIPPVSSFEGTGQGATSSIFSNTGYSKPSGRGAKHRIIFAFVSQSWSKGELLEITS